MGYKSVYEQYKSAMLNYYKRTTASTIKRASGFLPTLEKDNKKLVIKMPLRYPSTEAQLSHTNGSGVVLRYDHTTKELLIQLGDFENTIDDTTRLPHVAERLCLLYHSDGTMDINHFSEDNIQADKRGEDDITKRTYSSMISYGSIPEISVEQLLNESDILDQVDTYKFEELSRRLNSEAPEFNIQTLSKDDGPEFSE